MDIDEAVSLATELLHGYRLDRWRVVVDRAKTRAGACRFDVREIGLSGPLTSLHSPSEVRQTILHEIAHALVGPAHSHDAVWRAEATRLGCSPRACLPRDSPRVAAPWVGTCPAGHTVARHRRPQRPASCRQCSRAYSPEHQFRWQFHDRT
jgi:predicted SprT family Zn-dependent metalloprotease